MKRSIWLGFDPREAAAFAVAKSSIERRLTVPLPIGSVDLESLRDCGLYRRPTEKQNGQLWDTISGAPMSTEFAISRFLTPALAKTGWALFADCDILARENLVRLFELADPSKAVMCVHHSQPIKMALKMDAQLQWPYPRKNWSSVMLFNCDHPANKALTPDLVNSAAGRDLHAFSWLSERDIGTIPGKWNWLVGYDKPSVDPAIVHFTDGYPLMPGYEDAAYANEWHAELRAWAAGQRLLAPKAA